MPIANLLDMFVIGFDFRGFRPLEFVQFYYCGKHSFAHIIQELQSRVPHKAFATFA